MCSLQRASGESKAQIYLMPTIVSTSLSMMRCLTRFHSIHSKAFLTQSFLALPLQPFLHLDFRRPGHDQRFSEVLWMRLYSTTVSPPERESSPIPSFASGLPRTCPGCGAYSQTLNPEEAGFYSASRKSIKAFVASQHASTRQASEAEDHTYTTIVAHADPSLLLSLGLDEESQSEEGIVLLSLFDHGTHLDTHTVRRTAVERSPGCSNLWPLP